jgi:O-antigen/teichoic acid export membrane protein
MSGQLSLVMFIAGQTAAFILAILVALVILHKKINLVLPRFSLGYFTNLIQNSLPFALILLLMASYNRMDGVMLERLLEDGDYHAGIYAASFRYMEAANMVVYLIAGLLLPMFASNPNKEELSELTLLGMRAVAIIAITITVLVIGFREYWMGIYKVFDPQYSSLIIYHMASFCCIAVSYVYGTLITAQARLKVFNWLLFFGVILNLILNLWLIPQHQAEGAAQATFVTQLVMMVGQIIIAKKLYKITLDVALAIRVVLYAALFSVVMIIIRDYVSGFWVLKILIGSFISIIIAFLLGVLRKDMIFALIEIKGTKS